MAATLLQLIEMVARQGGRHHDGTVTSGTTNTIVDDTLIQPNDVWNGFYVYVDGADGAAPEGEERYVSDYDQATFTLSIAPDLTAVVAADDTYMLLPERRADIVAAINFGIRKAGTHFPVPTVDITTITIVDDTYVYTLPTTVIYLQDVKRRSGTDEPWRSLNAANWDVRGTPGAQSLYLLSLDSLAADDTIQLEFTARLAQLSADTDTLTIGTPAEDELIAYVVEYALYYLSFTNAHRNPEGQNFRSYLTLMSEHKEEAKELAKEAPHYQGAGRIHGPTRPGARG